MKEELSGVDVYFLTQELQKLVGARFQKAYARDKEVYFQLHKTGEGKQLLKIRLPGLLYLTESRPEFPKTPTGFITFLRKRLSGTRVESLHQVGLDKIVIITFGTKSEPEMYKLIIELIAPGNVILVGRKPIKGGMSDEMILSLLKPQSYKDRSVRGGVPYEAPPPVPNPLVDDEKTILERVKNTEMDSLVKALAVGLSLGGEYAELICERINIDKKSKPTDADIKKAITETKKLLEEEPVVAVEENRITFFAEKPTHETISAALDERFTVDEVIQEKTKKKKKSILEIQEQQKKGLEKASEENQAKGELIYENYADIKEILAQIKAGEEPTNKAFKKYDKKIRTIIVEF